jgi:hypothetical protein
VSVEWNLLKGALKMNETETLRDLRCGLLTEREVCFCSWTEPGLNGKRTNAFGMHRSVEVGEAKNGSAVGCLFASAAIARVARGAVEESLLATHTRHIRFDNAISWLQLDGLACDLYPHQVIMSREEALELMNRDHFAAGALTKSGPTALNVMAYTITCYDRWAESRGDCLKSKFNTLSTPARLQLITAIEKILVSRAADITCRTEEEIHGVPTAV